MASAAEIQSLLRFLSQDAKLPLGTAMSKVKDLQSAGLTSPIAIAQTDLTSVKAIFPDEKLAKQVHNAAKRSSKKRPSSDASIPSPPPSKRRKQSPSGVAPTGADLEESLTLPVSSTDEEAISTTTLITNRAPLVLAFAVTLLKYTMPEQPLSSRLSLAQAVVSVNSRSKAVSIGLESGKSAEEEGWGQGQPVVKIMGREIRVLKRWGYELGGQKATTNTDGDEPSKPAVKEQEGPNRRDYEEPRAQDSNIESDGTVQGPLDDKEPHSEEVALWGLDLEALKKSNGPIRRPAAPTGPGSLPIYTPQSARSYLLRSFCSAELERPSKPAVAKKTHAAAGAAEKEENLGLLLGALDLLYQSWAPTLGRDDLDRRAWSWYVHVRPNVENGIAGWGGKGEVKLASILSLRRRSFG